MNGIEPVKDPKIWTRILLLKPCIKNFESYSCLESKPCLKIDKFKKRSIFNALNQQGPSIWENAKNISIGKLHIGVQNMMTIFARNAFVVKTLKFIVSTEPPALFILSPRKGLTQRIDSYEKRHPQLYPRIQRPGSVWP